MKSKSRLLVPLSLVLVLAAGLWAAFHLKPVPQTEEAKAATELVGASFGLVDSAGNLAETNQIPNRPGVQYGWELQLRSAKEKVAVKEVFQLPAGARWTPDNPPPDWMEVTGGRFSTNGDLRVREYNVRIGQLKAAGRLYGGLMDYLQTYQVIEGDPNGEYRVGIYLDGKFAKVFVFQVFAP